ncbi:MAG: hypothetical protein JW822_13225 [Spirochaetales bacterium]|nr:hypothetical protein [Spirochaetales bacterium]
MKKIVLALLMIFSMIQIPAQEQGKLKIKTGYEFKNIDNSPDTYAFILETSYELIPGLEPGFKLRYEIVDQDSGAVSGIDRPVIGVKYTSDSGLGGFVDVYLPFASEDIAGAHPEIGADLAVFYDTFFEGFIFYTEALFNVEYDLVEDMVEFQGGFIVQPGYMIFDNLELYIAAQAYFGLDGGYMIIFKPGLEYKIMDMLTIECGISFAIDGEDAKVQPGFDDWYGWILELHLVFSLL